MTEQTVQVTIKNTGGQWAGSYAVGNQSYDLDGRDRNGLYVTAIKRVTEIAKREDNAVRTVIDDHHSGMAEVVLIDPDGGVERVETKPLTAEPVPSRKAAHAAAAEAETTPETGAQAPAAPAPDTPSPSAQAFVATLNQAPAAPAPTPELQPSYETASFGQRPRASQGAVIAREGFNGTLNRMSGGMLRLPASRAEARRARLVETLQAVPAKTPVTWAFMNSKGGGGKTTTLYNIGAIIGSLTSHKILALDGNDNHGTLGDKGRRQSHDATVRDLLNVLDAYTKDNPSGTFVPPALIAPYLHAQPEKFDVLPSQNRAYDTKVLTAPELRRLYELVSPSFSHVLIDTGNNIEGDASTSTVQVAADVADHYVFSMMGKIDNARNAFATMDYLIRAGFGEKVRASVAIVNKTHTTAPEDLDEIIEFLKGRVSTYVIVPWDAELDRGRDIRFDRLAPATRNAYLDAAVAILDPNSHNRP
ncbi:MinD/ParA family protein [Paenarthrobacter sp. NPDC090522]|uniref:MinD/ParA family ATP-binding protein n=1 Tax=Paenarthrobacter sp. NPDC090522 TaxID=3364383 RepID=UPI00381AFCF5